MTLMNWIIVTLVLSLQGSMLSPHAMAANSDETLDFRNVAAGDHSGLTLLRYEVILDQASFDEFWQIHAAPSFPREKAPVVDFDREMIIAAFLGQQRTGGYQIRVSAIHKHPQHLSVDLHVSRPPQGVLVTQMLTQPYHVVATQRVEQPVSFQLHIGSDKGLENN